MLQFIILLYIGPYIYYFQFTNMIDGPRSFRQPKLVTRDNNDLYHFLHFIRMLGFNGCYFCKRSYSPLSARRLGREGVACLATPLKIPESRGPPKSCYVVFMHISSPGNASKVRLDPKLAQCRTSVYDVIPTSNPHKLHVLRLLIIHIYKYNAFTHRPERKHTHICLYDMYVQSEIYQTVLNC